MTDRPTDRGRAPLRSRKDHAPGPWSNAGSAKPSPEDAEHAAVAAQLAQRTRATQASLFLSRIGYALWPLGALVFAFAAVTAAGLWAVMPELLRAGVLISFAVLAIVAVIYAAPRLVWPSRTEARARLDLGRDDRPIASFDDTLALGSNDPSASALWRAHKRRVAKAALGVRAPAPDFRVGGDRDPWALRFFAAFALGAAFLLGASDGRIAEALRPIGVGIEPTAGLRAPTLEMWATPPAYTGVAPVYFADDATRFGERTMPAGTVLSLRLFDAPERPELTFDPPFATASETADPAPSIDFRETNAPTVMDGVLLDEGDGVYAAQATLTEQLAVSIALGDETLSDLRFAVTPDAPPTVRITQEPEPGARGSLAFTYETGDDYGVVEAWTILQLDDEANEGIAPEPAAPLRVALPTPLAAPGEVLEEEVEQDFVGHEWTELPVMMTIVVVDAAGQVAESDPIRFILPGRRFSEPMAKAVIEQRADLAWNRARAPRVRRTLEALTRHPDDFFTDPSAYLVLRSAISRLAYALHEETFNAQRDNILERLYAAAERLEDGGLDNAAERLARAQRRLRDAIENGASDEELQALMEELRAAIQDYLQALAQMAEQNPDMAQQMPEGGQALTQQQLQEMLEALEQAARDGAMAEAQQMLSMLEQLLNSLRPGGPSQQAGDGQQQQGQNQNGELDELQDMIGEQQGLAERSFDEFLRRRQQGQEGQPGQPGQGQQGQQGQGQQGQGQQPGQQPGQSSPGQGQGQLGQTQPGDPQRPGQGGLGENQQNPQARGGVGGDDPTAQGREGFGRGERLGDLRQRQEALRDALRQFRRGLDDDTAGASGEALDRAEDAMREAERALNGQDPGRAADEQMRAVDALRDGARAAAESLEQQAAQDGEGLDGAGANNRDPFNRESGRDGFGDGSVKGGVPGEMDPSRARDILEELRRRAGERERPRDELDYFERLLDRFQ